MCDCDRCLAGGHTYTEAHRAACEAHYVAAMGTDAERSAYLATVRERRGADSYATLRTMAWEQIPASPRG